MADPSKSGADAARVTDELERLRRRAGAVPADPDTRLFFAKKLLDYRQVDEAIVEIRAVIAMFPNHLEARKLLELAHALRG
jgi:hypothetical protein